MKGINELLKKNSLRANSYQKKGKAVIVDTQNGKYVIKPSNTKTDIFNYLITRNFNYYPDIVIVDNDYEITRFIEDIAIPDEQKMNDLINLTALLHSKTTYYKEIDEGDYKELYEDLKNNIEYLKEYYSDLITIIESKVYMSPPEYLLARNISSIFAALNFCDIKIEEWHKKISDMRKMRVSVIHNNLKLSHFIKNSSDYLISWDKAKIDIPIFDLYKLYNNHALDFDFTEILKKYENNYPLHEEELDLLFILISMPSKIEFNTNNYNLCKKISNELDKIYKTNKIINEYKKIN